MIYDERDAQVIASLNARCAELSQERDQAVAEASARDKKWMSGLDEAFGVKLDWEPEVFKLRFVPTASQYVQTLRSRVEQSDRDLRTLKKEIDILRSYFRKWKDSHSLARGFDCERQAASPCGKCGTCAVIAAMTGTDESGAMSRAKP